MSVTWHVAPAGNGEAHWIEDCPCGPEVEIKTRVDGSDGVLIVHRAYEALEDVA